MEDAYVIGIRLALENGVSVGIASIAADLHALDAAIAVTSANLQRLQSLASNTAPPRPGGRTEPASAASNGPPADAPILAPPTPPASPTPRAAVADAARAGEPVIPARAEIAAPAASAAAPQAAPIIRILSPTSSNTALPPPAPPATASVAPPPPAAPSPTVLAATGETSRAPHASIFANSVSAPAAASPAPTSAVPSARLPDVGGARMPAFAPPALATAFREQVQEASAPSRSPAAMDARQPSPAAPPSYPATQAAPPAREAQSGAMQGDVYLDGTRLGRWMSDRLARDAGRPQSGTTGFDPRLGPAWPGPLQGS